MERGMSFLGVEARDEVVAAAPRLLPQSQCPILLALPSPRDEYSFETLGEEVAAQPPAFHAHYGEVAPRFIMIP